MGGDKGKRTDATRQERKAKKRKLEDAIPDVPGDNDIEVPETAAATNEQAPKKRKRDGDEAGDDVPAVKEKKSKKEKKEKRKSKGEEQSVPDTTEGEEKPSAAAGTETGAKVVENENGEAPKKSKKERKAERRAREAAEAAATKTEPGEEPAAASSTTTPASEGAPTATAAKEKKPKKEKKKPNGNGEKSEKAARFIVFIGSLPYTANPTSIQKHFASVKPTSIRSPMQPAAPTKSKGYAFLEFASYDHMKTCLKVFHHSTFDDGISPPRKISVELTAGGGGNTKGRKDKIRAKNEKLNEERQRRIHEEAKAKAEKRDGGAPAAEADTNSIHPSRRARVPGAAI